MQINVNELLRKKRGIVNKQDYSFINSNPNLKDKIIFLTLGGSYAYGTNIETSDVDVRGISLNTKDEILLGMDHEQSVNEATDTTIYTTRKMIHLFAQGNPNTIEMLGSIEENALFVSDFFNEYILKNKNLFLTRNVFFTFGGYGRAQLSRLNNKLGRLNPEVETQNILRSIKNASVHLKERYNIDLDTDILFSANGANFNCNIKDLNKADMQSCLMEIASIFKDYNKLGKRNQSAIEHNKLNKHCMHLVRLFLMAIDILRDGEIITYRKKDHDLLMSIRNNENEEWIKDNMLTERAEKFVEEKEKEMKDAFDNSKLPDTPDRNRINDLIKNINTYILGLTS